MNRKQLFSLSIALCLSGVALAGGPVGKYAPAKALPTAYPVTMDTRNFANQINHRYQFHAESPENPLPPLVQQQGIPIINNMPIGRADGAPRVVTGARFPGIGATGWTPPDPNIAAGPTYLVETVNSSVAFFRKSDGAKTFEQIMDGPNGFFSGLGAGNFIFDPKVMFDKLSGRFFVFALELDETNLVSKMLIAVSTTSDPNGAWNKYRVESLLTAGSNKYWMDYPSVATSSDGLVFCGNMFPLTSGAGFAGVQFVVLKKADLLAGRPVTPSSLLDGNSASAQVARNTEPNQSNILGLALAGTATMRCYSINTPAATPTLVSTDVAIPVFQRSQNGALSVSGHRLDTLGDRIFNIYQRNGHLVVGHSVQQDAGRAGGRANAKWYQFNINGWPSGTLLPTVAQTGQIDTGSDDDTFVPALDENLAGDVTALFSRSSSTVVADVMIAGRKKTDPAGQMSTPTVLFGSNVPYGGAGGSNRWGDYFDVALDPTDSLTYWGVGMSSDASGGWQTVFFKWKISQSIGNPVDAFPTAIAKYEGSTSAGQVSNVTTIDQQYYTVSSIGPVGGQQLASAVADFQLPLATTLSSLTIKDTVVGGTGTTQIVFLFNWNSHAWDAVEFNRLTTSNQTFAKTIPNFSNYIDGTGHLRTIVRGVNPPRSSRSTLPFKLGIDQLLITTTPL